MKKILTLLICVNLIHAEEPMEILKTFENCYDAMIPAQEKSEEAFAWFSGVRYPILNAVMHLLCQGEVADKVDSLLAKAPSDLPLSFWLHPYNQAEGLIDILKERGFQYAITCPIMSWKVEPISSPSFDIRPADMEIFHRIFAIASEIDDSIKEEFANMMKKFDLENYLVYLDGKPVCTATFFVNGKTGAIFNMATLPEYQKKGCASAMTQFLMHRAYALGLKEVVLLSSPPAEKIYSRLGFQKAFDIEIYAR